MKLNQIAVAALLASLNAMALPQVTTSQPGPVVTHSHVPGQAAHPQDLESSERHLIAAIQKMTAALPIYDGHRATSILKAHQALVALDQTTKYHLGIALPTIKDDLAPSSAKRRYTAKQIAESHRLMTAALRDLNLAQSLLGYVGPNNTLAKPLMDSGNLDQLAIQQVRTAIALYSK